MSKVPVNPPSGFRDFLPGEAALRLELVSIITGIYRSHGFQPIGMPMLEALSTLQGKGGGGENEKLIFKVMKRGEDLIRGLNSFRSIESISGKENLIEDRTQVFLGFGEVTGAEFKAEYLADMGLRFDLTLPLARYYARFRNQLPKPFKVFQIGPVWRADRPQKGRYREFYQCDVDIVGSKEIGAEVDCISAILEVFDAVGITGAEVHINDRRLLSSLGEHLKISPVAWARCLVSLDKLDKTSWQSVLGEILDIAGIDGADLTLVRNVLIALLETPTPAFSPTWTTINPEVYDDLHKLRSLLGSVSKSRVIFNPTLVRGQDYYTGTIFEIRHPELSGSLGGGGRYNRLLEVFGSPETPAFGGSIGFERLVMLLQEKDAQDKTDSGAPDLFFPLFDGSLRSQIQGLAAKLRAAGLRVDVYPDAAKLKHQFKYADDRRIPFTAILGADEAKAGQIKLKDMAKGTESSYSIQPPEAFVEEMKSLCKKSNR